MPAARSAALGFSVHTGRAVVVAVAGPPDAAEILAKARIDVATTFDDGAVFHVGQQLPLEAARVLAHDAEVRFSELARSELAAFTGRLDARLVAAGMVAAEPKPLPPLEAILKSHALVHAAEGELYRRVFATAAAALGVEPQRVPADALARQTGAALGLPPSKLAARLATMGKASGKPWAADQKQAALVAWLALATASRK